MASVMDVRPGDVLRLWHAGELVIAVVGATCGDQVRTVTSFAPGMACICDMHWNRERLAAGRGVEFEVSKMPRRIG